MRPPSLDQRFMTTTESVLLSPEVATFVPRTLPVYPQDGWNRTECEYSRVDTLQIRFERQAALTPDATAAICDADRLTYSALNERANRLAHYLRQEGAAPGERIAIAVPRSLDMLVAVLAVIKSGAAYVPLDPAYPLNRLSLMLEDSGCRLLIDGPAGGTIPFAGPRLSLNSETDVLARQPASNPTPLATSTDLAYVIYTSGSTGRPKGVQLAHRGVINFVDALRTQLQLRSSDVFLALASLSFDMSVLDMFVSLCNGACIAIAPPGVAGNPRRLLEQIEATGATYLQATPSAWRMMLDAGLPAKPGLTALVGGEALPQDLAEALLTRVGGVWNLYGPTETTVYSTMYRYTGGKPLVGRPIANTQIYILDPQMQPVALGEAGELHIGGDGLAVGYLNLPVLTSERFVQSPFSHNPAVRLYKTGDVARYLDNGDIECLGRIDHQVKIRGYRIELGEIETLLRRHAVIADAVVVAAPDSSGQQSLVAYCVSQGSKATSAELRAHLLSQLPEFMLPSRFVWLTALPLTPNGKVDRNALPSPDSVVEAPATAESRTLDEIEAQMTQLWSAALRRPNVGLHENFFDIGGHSLMAVTLTRDIERLFNQVVPLDALWMEGNTVESMSALIRRGSADRSRLVMLREGGRKPPLFVIHTMRGSINEYHALASQLPSDRAIIGVRSKGLYGDAPPAPRLREFAEDVVAAIRKEHPTGPYLLAGYSVGGLIAVEAAVALRQQGAEVSFLGLLDTPSPGFQVTLSLSSRLKARVVRERRKLHRKLQPLRTFLNIRDDDADVPGTDPSRISEHAMVLYRVLIDAEANYQVETRCPVPIHLFISQDIASSVTSKSLGWDAFAQEGVVCHPVAGKDHEDFMKPQHADVLAQAIAAQLP